MHLSVQRRTQVNQLNIKTVFFSAFKFCMSTVKNDIENGFSSIAKSSSSNKQQKEHR